jgi:hypothetical protein
VWHMPVLCLDRQPWAAVSRLSSVVYDVPTPPLCSTDDPRSMDEADLGPWAKGAGYVDARLK